MFLANIDESLTGATTLLHEFGAPSGLQVNWAKTCLFHVRQWMENPNQVGSIRWEPHCLIYLGTHIYHMQEDLLEGNVGRALRGIKGSMAFWSTLPLSVAGRVALLKMVALPRLLYYFRTLSIWIQSSLFKKLCSLIGGFILGYWQTASGFNHDDAT